MLNKLFLFNNENYKITEHKNTYSVQNGSGIYLHDNDIIKLTKLIKNKIKGGVQPINLLIIGAFDNAGNTMGDRRNPLNWNNRNQIDYNILLQLLNDNIVDKITMVDPQYPYHFPNTRSSYHESQDGPSGSIATHSSTSQRRSQSVSENISKRPEKYSDEQSGRILLNDHRFSMIRSNWTYPQYIDIHKYTACISFAMNMKSYVNHEKFFFIELMKAQGTKMKLEFNNVIRFLSENSINFPKNYTEVYNLNKQFKYNLPDFLKVPFRKFYKIKYCDETNFKETLQIALNNNEFTPTKIRERLSLENNKDTKIILNTIMSICQIQLEKYLDDTVDDKIQKIRWLATSNGQDKYISEDIKKYVSYVINGSYSLDADYGITYH